MRSTSRSASLNTSGALLAEIVLRLVLRTQPRSGPSTKLTDDPEFHRVSARTHARFDVSELAC